MDWLDDCIRRRREKAVDVVWSGDQAEGGSDCPRVNAASPHYFRGSSSSKLQSGSRPSARKLESSSLYIVKQRPTVSSISPSSRLLRSPRSSSALRSGRALSAYSLVSRTSALTTKRGPAVLMSKNVTRMKTWQRPPL